MKQNSNNSTGQNKPISNAHTSRPQNKDDIDSRSNEEQDTKGDDITHNKKEVHNNKHRKQED